MFAFGKTSRAHLDTVHPDLRAVAEKVMSYQVFDFAIVWGHRGQEAQDQAFLAGNSTKRWPDSLHNRTPSPALDFAPWVNGGIPWKDTHAFAVIGGMFIAAGRELGIDITYGGDWDMDGETTDQRLQDWGHVQLVQGGR